MGLFSKKDDISNVETIIGTGCVIKGDIVSQGTIEVFGSVDGNINAVCVSTYKGSNVKSVKAGRVDIDGVFEGTIEAEFTSLGQNSVIKGNIITKDIEIASGAEIKGSLNIDCSKNNNETKETVED